MKPEGSRPAAAAAAAPRAQPVAAAEPPGLRPVLPPAEIGKEAPIADASLIFAILRIRPCGPF